MTKLKRIMLPIRQPRLSYNHYQQLKSIWKHNSELSNIGSVLGTNWEFPPCKPID